MRYFWVVHASTPASCQPRTARACTAPTQLCWAAELDVKQLTTDLQTHACRSLASIHSNCPLNTHSHWQHHHHHPLRIAEWVLVDAACHAYSMASVPLYDTLGPDTVEYIANHAGLAAVACSADVLPKLLEVLPRCSTLKLVVSEGPFFW
jgi:hypothetical protein